MNYRGSRQPVRVGIIGLGYWGPKLVRNFHDLPGVVVESAADLRRDRLDDLHKHYPDIQLTSNYKDLLNNQLDAVIIATPVDTHYKLAREALLAGKHVLVEKPITNNSVHGMELKMIDFGFLFFCLGWIGISSSVWERIVWAFLALLFAVQMWKNGKIGKG